jgi:hypothetical protein
MGKRTGQEIINFVLHGVPDPENYSPYQKDRAAPGQVEAFIYGPPVPASLSSWYEFENSVADSVLWHKYRQADDPEGVTGIGYRFDDHEGMNEAPGQ